MYRMSDCEGVYMCLCNRNLQLSLLQRRIYKICVNDENERKGETEKKIYQLNVKQR